jgi:hypothetical protein
MANRKRTKGQTTILKTLHSKVKIEQHEPHKNPGVNFNHISIIFIGLIEEKRSFPSTYSCLGL